MPQSTPVNLKRLPAILLMVLINTAHAQNVTNPCGVVSRFTPGQDSVVSGTTYTDVTFTSTSVNATALQWSVRGIVFGTGSTFQYSFNMPGTYTIMLVAKNGTCADTSYCFYINPGVQPADRKNTKAYYGFAPSTEEVSGIVAAPDSGYLLGGTTTLFPQVNQPLNSIKTGVVIKVSPSGCIEWTRAMKSLYGGTLTGLFTLPDSTYGITGAGIGYYIRVLDAAGNLKWNRNLRRDGYYVPATAMAQSADKGYVLISDSWDRGINVVKLDAAANLAWSQIQYKSDPQNRYNTYGYYNSSLVVKGNDIYIAASNYFSPSNSTLPGENFAVLLKMDALTGQTRWRKTYKVNNAAVYVRNLENRGDGLLLNTSAPSGDNTITYLDTAGNVINSRIISAPGLNATILTSSVKVRSNGDLYLLNQGSSPLSLQPYITYKSNCALLDKDFNLKWSRSYGAIDKGRFFYHAIGNDGTFAALGNEFGYAVPAYTGSTKMTLKKFDTTGLLQAEPACGFLNFPLSISSGTVTVQNFMNASDSSYPMSLSDTGAVILQPNAEVRYTCPTGFIDSCSVLKVTGPAGICNLSANYTYRLHRNKSCNQPPLWQIKPAATIVSQSDSALTVRFTAFGNYSVSALLPYSCTPIKDSVQVSVASRSPTLSLGRDTSLCPNNTLLVDAGAGFYTYEWQDGSTSRTYTIAGPGEYRVKTTDSCGNTFRDTLQVAQAASVAVDAGPDRFKCNADTLHLTAPAGYRQYQWSPNYQISATGTAAVTVNPLVDTSYFLKVEKSPGCYGYDTIRVQVHRSPLINLGNDTSICAGTTISLNVKIAFTSYLWSTGATSAAINVGAAGTYRLTATDSLGCRSADTFQIVKVYPLPVVQLSRDSLLCTGSSRTLDAGAGFATYRWNTGSITQTIQATTLGTYSVKVTDTYNCSTTDSTRITRIVPLPAGFLPDEPIQICSYEKAVLQPVVTFNKYIWSNGATTAGITVSLPGPYRLQVTDRYNCTGSDTAIVVLKDCIKGAYFPSAFTPNYDGRNDRFLPLLYGVVVSYQLTIYNRYGEVVFSSSNSTQGWDGRSKNEDLATGTYLWQCSFRFEGETSQVQKGSVLLIR